MLFSYLCISSLKVCFIFFSMQKYSILSVVLFCPFFKRPPFSPTISVTNYPSKMHHYYCLISTFALLLLLHLCVSPLPSSVGSSINFMYSFWSSVPLVSSLNSVLLHSILCLPCLLFTSKMHHSLSLPFLFTRCLDQSSAFLSVNSITEFSLISSLMFTFWILSCLVQFSSQIFHL